MHGILEGRAVAVEDHQPEAPAPGPGATAPNAPAAGPDAPAAAPGAPDTDAVGAAGGVPWGADSIFAPGTEPIPDPAVDSPPDTAPGDRKSTRLNSSHVAISCPRFRLKQKQPQQHLRRPRSY